MSCLGEAEFASSADSARMVATVSAVADFITASRAEFVVLMTTS